MIGLVDGNNFYVSCERVFDPSLEGKPVAVMSNNDGCCISRSYEFKALNIPMGTPFFQLKPLIPKHGLILKSSNYELYGDLSRRVIATLSTFTPDVEQYSIDEAFIHVTLPAGSDYFEFGRKVRQTVLQWVGIPCGVGFAKSKTLAKIANHIGKKQPTGVFVMPDDPRSVLEKLPVSEVWGVGGRLTAKLEKLGLRTAWQLACADTGDIRRKFSVVLAKTVLELRGEPVIEHEDPDALPQSITHSRTFGKPVIDFEDLVESVCTYTAKASEKLRKEHQKAAGVNIYFQYYPEYEPVRLDGGFTSMTVTFENPTSNTGRMLSAITPKLRGIFIPGRRYKKSGVLFFGLESDANRQIDLFADTASEEKDDRLSKALDSINTKYGRGTIFHLSEGVKKPWQMRRDMLTPNYTTSWSQIPLVK
ncbi:DNA polymerase V subunit UmuC [Victivallales bacterium CCUG 44730]|nr:DNA polymerase V subunit UmuC [Victivallales bacterium CCUG 44730]